MDNRSFLFMPGNNPAMIFNSDVLGSDVIILDLEDSVSLSEKDSARILVREAVKNLEFYYSKLTIRINPIDSPYWEEDLKEIIPYNPYGIVIPKADRESILIVERIVDEIEKEYSITEKTIFYPLIEKPEDLVDLKNIVESSKRIKGILFGAEDYCSYMGVERTNSSKEIEYARFVIATTAKAYGIEGIDTPFTDVEDIKGLEADTRFVKSIGFTGKLSINPKHINTINKVFSPTIDEIEYSKAIIQANENAKKKGLGAFSFNGKMVDLPIVKRAEKILESAAKWSLI